MQFIDPFQLLQLDVSDPNTLDAAALAQAEANLAPALANPDGQMTVDGRAIPVADVKELITALHDPLTRRHLWDMRSVAGLVPYLEGKPNPNPLPLINKCKAMGPEFFAYASQWLAWNIDARMEAALSAGKWSDVATLGRAAEALDSKYEANAVASGKIFFEKHRVTIEEAINGDAARLTKDGIRPLHHLPMLGALNSLPPSQQPIRDEVALALGRLISKVATTEEGKMWTFSLFEDMMKIQTSPAVTAKLKTLNKIVKRDSGVAAKEADNRRKGKRMVEISIAVLVGLFLLRLILLLTDVM